MGAVTDGQMGIFIETDVNERAVTIDGFYGLSNQEFRIFRCISIEPGKAVRTGGVHYIGNNLAFQYVCCLAANGSRFRNFYHSCLILALTNVHEKN